MNSKAIKIKNNRRTTKRKNTPNTMKKNTNTKMQEKLIVEETKLIKEETKAIASYMQHENMLKQNQIAKAIFTPKELTWSNLPCFPHPYGIFHDNFDFNVAANASGALGLCFLPRNVPACGTNANSSNIYAWLGNAFTGTSLVSSSATNPCSAISNTNMLIKTDVGIQNCTEIACIGYKVTVSSLNPFTSTQGKVYAALRPMSYNLLGAVPYDGTTVTSGIGIDSYNYTGVLQDLPSGYSAAIPFVGNNTITVNYRPSEVDIYQDFPAFHYYSTGSPATLAPNLVDNLIFVTVVGAAAAASINVQVQALYAYTASTKSIIEQTMKKSSSSEVPQQVFHALVNANLQYVVPNLTNMGQYFQ